jgi:outer membrane protein assembly factor BamA
MVATAELRVPLALVAKPLGGLPYGLDRLSLSLFYDYGRVWRRPRNGLPRDLSSAGVELNWDLVVLYDVPLRLRTGLAVPLEDGSVTDRGEAQFSVSFGSEF